MAKRVFFSFHYQDVIDFRANVVRMHSTTKSDNAGYFDASIWESAKKTGTVALKKLINSELKNTSVTCVLIGSQTYERRWVRYEIIKSIAVGNIIIGIHINSIPAKDKLTKKLGPNPLKYLGIRYSDDGKSISFREYSNGSWIDYADYEGYSLKNANIELRGKTISLFEKYKTYDWIEDDGYNKFPTWIGI